MWSFVFSDGYTVNSWEKTALKAAQNVFAFCGRHDFSRAYLRYKANCRELCLESAEANSAYMYVSDKDLPF